MSDLSGLRVGFISARSASNVDQALWTEAGVGRLLEQWANQCKQLTVALSLAPGKQRWHDHKLDNTQITFLPLPWLPSIARGFHKAPRCRRVIRQVEAQSDVVIVQLPFAAPLALLGPKAPRVYHVCADVQKIAHTSPWYRGLKRVVALSASNSIHRLYRMLLHAPRTDVVTNGEDLLRTYKLENARSVVSSTLLASEVMSVPRSRSADAPFRVLFVGYLRHEKGIDTLFQAFEQLLGEVPNAELCFVGSQNMEDRGMTEDVAREVRRLQEKASVQFLGHREFGKDLFQCFADADALAVPSRSEGTPRVLIEARAFGCTVVASRVGGIPSSVADEVDGLLVPPGDASALATALVRIASERNFRQTLIDAGIERARHTTVESFAEVIAQVAANCARAA